MVELNGRLLRFDLDKLHLDVLRTERERDVRCRTRGGDVVGDLHICGDRIGSDHLVAVRSYPRDERLEIRHGEADVVDRRADGTAVRRLHRTEKHQHIRKFDDLLLTIA